MSTPTQKPDGERERLDEAALAKIFAMSPFIATLGLEVVAMDYDRSELTVRMPLAPHLERRVGTKQFHGGGLAALIDTVGDFALGMLLGGGIPTMNLRIDYLKPAVGDAVTAVARVRRRGRSAAVIDIDVLDEKDALVAIGRGTYVPIVG
ncbi:MAG: PaaI family thioesterase [Hyphomicrobiaceae bacterium]